MSAATEAALARITAAREEYFAWRPESGLSLLEQAWAKGDHTRGALAGVVGGLRALIDLDDVTPEKVTQVLVEALTRGGQDVAIGVTHDPKPAALEAEGPERCGRCSDMYDEDPERLCARCQRAEDGRSGFAGYRNPPAYGAIPEAVSGR